MSGLSYYEDMRRQFGSDVIKLLKSISKNKTKLAILKNRSTFLVKCRDHAILPKSLNHRFGKFGQHITRFRKHSEKFLFKLLIEEFGCTLGWVFLQFCLN
jgi:hypothetical protein